MYEVFSNQFANLSEITGLPFIRSGNRMISSTYIDGSPHNQKDKTWAILKSNGVYIKENGGDDLSLPEWLKTYGGGVDRLGLKGSEKHVEQVQVERIFVPSDVVDATIPMKYKGELFTFLSSVFSEERVLEVFHRYNVGEFGSVTIFWYQNELNKFCHDNRIKYLANGHRDKDSNAWRKYKIDVGYSGKCVFGSHLLPDWKGDVCVVESEKTALIMALVDNNRLWVATGGANKIFLARDDWLRYGDYDDAGRGWNGVEWWKGLDIKDGWDVGDWVINKFKK